MSNWMITPAEVFAASPVVPVMVVNDPAQAIPMAKALLAGGISVFEITLRTPAALEAIALIAKEMPDALVGAGTVLNIEQYEAAVAVGARFIISPGITPSLLAHGAKSAVPLIPGVATPSEVMLALEFGYDHLKFFPAEINGGVKALAAISAPLGQVTFCPTGGVGLHNIADYLALKCVGTVGGSWMLPLDAIKNNDWDEITRLSREAVAKARA